MLSDRMRGRSGSRLNIGAMLPAIGRLLHHGNLPLCADPPLPETLSGGSPSGTARWYDASSRRAYSLRSRGVKIFSSVILSSVEACPLSPWAEPSGAELAELLHTEPVDTMRPRYDPGNGHLGDASGRRNPEALQLLLVVPLEQLSDRLEERPPPVQHMIHLLGDRHVDAHLARQVV